MIPAATEGTDSNIYTRTTAALTSYFTPRSNTAFEIYTFRQARQGEGETIDAFATRLRQFAKSCEFADTEKEVANQITFSCNSQSLRHRALCDDYNLEQLLAAARIKRGTSSHIGKRQRSSTCELGHRRNGGRSHHSQSHRRRDSPPHRSQSRHRSKMPDTNDRTDGKSRRKTGMCHYCGYDLPHRVCPARGKRCSACGKRNHFSQVCQSSGKSSKQDNGSVNSVEKDPQHFSDEDYDYSFSVNTREHDNILSTKNNSSHLPSCSVQIFGTPVLMTIYSGASVNIVDQSTDEQFPVMPSLRNPPRKVYTYGSNTPLPLVGVTDVTLAHNGRQFKTEIHIVKGSGGNLLGFQAAQELGMLSLAQQVSHSSPCPDNAITQRFPELFSGIGKIRNKVIKLHIDETVVPKQQRHRRIPFHVRKDVEAAIAQLEADDIIEKADGPTPWVSPLVVFPKKFRLCIDMQEANKAIQREKHVMPTIDDLIADLNGAQVFSTLDLAQGYHQYELDPSSRYITTFSTNNALYHYKRLMFGLNAASEIFQNAVAAMLCGLEGAKNISDDIIVFGRTQDEHDRNLQATFQRLAQHNPGNSLNQP